MVNSRMDLPAAMNLLIGRVKGEKDESCDPQQGSVFHHKTFPWNGLGNPFGVVECANVIETRPELSSVVVPAWRSLHKMRIFKVNGKAAIFLGPWQSKNINPPHGSVRWYGLART
jgi:hypothetical protein